MPMTTHSILAVLCLLMAILVFVVWRSPELRGLFSEIKLYCLARLCLRPPKYQSLERSTVTELLDHPTHHEIVVSPYGVFCIEYVSYCGHVESHIDDPHWYLHQGRKWYRFSNPVQRAQQRAKSMVKNLNLPAEHVHALTVFSGSSHVDDSTLGNVFNGAAFIKHVRQFKKVVLPQSRIQGVVKAFASLSPLQAEFIPGTKRERIDAPIASGRALPQSSDSAENGAESVQVPPETKHPQPILAGHSCPVCGDKMQLRKITKGNRQGMHLWGCASFPDCRTLQWLK